MWEKNISLQEEGWGNVQDLWDMIQTTLFPDLNFNNQKSLFPISRSEKPKTVPPQNYCGTVLWMRLCDIQEGYTNSAPIEKNPPWGRELRDALGPAEGSSSLTAGLFFWTIWIERPSSSSRLCCGEEWPSKGGLKSSSIWIKAGQGAVFPWNKPEVWILLSRTSRTAWKRRPAEPSKSWSGLVH